MSSPCVPDTSPARHGSPRRQAGTGRRSRRPLLAAVVLLAFAALLAAATPAAAHAVLTGSDPRDGTVLKTAPKQVTVTFDESVALLENSLRVLDPDNRPVTAGDPEHAGGRANTARVPLTGGLRQGTYTVSWRVVSADSHAVTGAFTFSVGKPSQAGPVPTALPAVPRATSALYDTARYVAYAGLALLIGVAVFVLACWSTGTAARVVRRPFLTGWWVLTLSTVALVLLRGPYASGDGPAAVLDPRLLTSTAGSLPGVALLARLALLLVVGLLLRRRVARWKAGRRMAAAGTLLALALGGTWVVAEHASAGIQVPVAVASTLLHLLAMAVWLGGLVALLSALYRAPADDPLPPAAAVRFSRLALASVAVLAATGVYQSWRGLGSWDALFHTSYGRILSFKVWTVLVVLAVAAHSRRWTGRLLHVPQQEPALATVGGGGADAPPGRTPTPVSPAAAEAHRRGLRRCVLAEVAVGAVVLALTTVLTGTEPGRAATEAAAVQAPVPGQPTESLSMVPFDTGSPSGRGKVQIVLEPGRVGRNTVQAVVYGADGSLVAVPELRLTFTLDRQHVGPLDAGLVDERGYWGSDTLNVPLAGTWTMKVTVRVSDIDQVTVAKAVKIGP
ncbi:copper resistance CopC/CopD family protein [Streptomyces sp. NBC_00996]|uniref:copper resistance CopC/CopD family protein n=1 Tax=Streptomyces sp. NBC_00996 TaxID=2903710 RepID=UPI00386C58AD|nr:copper resistance protein CopC [Streptomyces sp. NBC_00996]